MKRASVPDFVANPTGPKYSCFPGEHWRYFEKRLRNNAGAHPRRNVALRQTTSYAAGGVPIFQSIVQLGPSGGDSHKLRRAWQHLSRQWSTSQMRRAFYCLSCQHHEASIQPKLRSGGRKVDRLPKCTLDAFKSVTREREIASRALFQPCTSASGLRPLRGIVLW